MTSFRIAPMSPLILGLTVLLLAIPAIFLTASLPGYTILFIPGIMLTVLYAWVWLLSRPGRFAAHPDRLEIIWPLKRRCLERRNITGVRGIDAQELKREVGRCVRVGVGGLWGAFGWLWTKNRGLVQMYISRTDGFVWIECAGGRPWLITPERPEIFVRVLSNQQGP
jgi:hypothetical protein